MAYGQINYSEKVGNGPYTIAEIGCFLTAYCNLLQETFSDNVAPPQLNTYFIEHNAYLADPEDGAGVKDDLSWNSVTKYNSHVVVKSAVDHGEAQTAGWPTTNSAIVKFYYKAPNGEMTTHFCKVADHTKHTIVDSWNGETTPTGEYGQPVAWATYGAPVVQAVPKPAVAPKPAPKPAPAPAKPAGRTTLSRLYLKYQPQSRLNLQNQLIPSTRR